MQFSSNQVKHVTDVDEPHADNKVSDTSPAKVLKSISNLYDAELAEAREVLNCEVLDKELAEARNAAYQDELNEMKGKLGVAEAKLCSFGNSNVTTSVDAEARTVLAEAHKNLETHVDMGSTTPGSSDAVEDDTSIASMVPMLMEAAMAMQRRPGVLAELTVDQVAAWAALTPLPFEVAQLLRDHAISGDILETLSHDDMIAMGIGKLGWRRQLELCRQELMDQFRTRQVTIDMDIQSGLTNASMDSIPSEQGGIKSNCVNPSPVAQQGLDRVPMRTPPNISQLPMDSRETQGSEPKAKAAKGFGQSRPLSAARATPQPRGYFIPDAVPLVVRRERSYERSHSSLTGEITPIPIRDSSATRVSSHKHTCLPLRTSGNCGRACDPPQRNLYGAVSSPVPPKDGAVGKGAAINTPKRPVTPEKSRVSRDATNIPRRPATPEKSRIASTSPGASKTALLRNCSGTIATKPRSATPDLPRAAQDVSRGLESANTGAVRNCAKFTVPRSRTATPEVPRASQDRKEIYAPKLRPGTPGTPRPREGGTSVTPRPGSSTPYSQRTRQDCTTSVEARQAPGTTDMLRPAHGRVTVLPPSRHPKWDDRAQRKIVGRF